MLVVKLVGKAKHGAAKEGLRLCTHQNLRQQHRGLVSQQHTGLVGQQKKASSSAHTPHTCANAAQPQQHEQQETKGVV